MVFDHAFADSNPYEFLHCYSCALCDMATFHVIGHSNLTIMGDKSRTTAIFEHCLCIMFAFQASSLHISKNVSYDYNNFVSSSLYHIPMSSLQGRQWVVGCGCYRIVGDSLAHDFQETSLR
jgi:hypothetical protein